LHGERGKQLGPNGGDSGVDGARPIPSGALTAVTYRLAGKICEDSVMRVAHPCPRRRITAGKLPPLIPTRDLRCG